MSSTVNTSAGEKPLCCYHRAHNRRSFAIGKYDFLKRAVDLVDRETLDKMGTEPAIFFKAVCRRLRYFGCIAETFGTQVKKQTPARTLREDRGNPLPRQTGCNAWMEDARNRDRPPKA